MQPTKVVGRRVVARLIDWIILYAIYAVVFFALADTAEEIAGQLGRGELDPNASTYLNFSFGGDQYSLVGGRAALFFLFTFLLSAAYFWVYQGLKGTTIGKSLLGIRVIKEDGSGPPGIFKAFVRELLMIVDGACGIVGLIVMLVNKSNKRVGDMVASTLVVRKEFAASGAGQPAVGGAAAGAVGAGAASTGGPSLGGPAGGFAAPVSGDPLAGGSAGGGGFAAPASGGAEPAVGGAQSVEGGDTASGGGGTTGAGEATGGGSNPPADWYPDPRGEKRLRYWDGNAWTDHTAD
ncbi:MAG TPA: RDD family protein [Solirubrobacteraceae bacterium]|nr:RDD family protein [Solirubrobacteraceae bacterium]